MRKILIIIFLFVFFVNFISASDCEISKDDLKIEVGVYDKISENGRFIFEKSKFQPNNKSKIVQEGDVLLIESFNISIDSSCEGYNIFGDSAEISLILPDENLTSESIIIPIKFIKNPNSFDYYLEINEFMSIPDFEFLLPYNNSKGEVSHIYYAPFTLDKIGEWEIKVGYNGVWYWKNIFNEGGSFKFINVLDRIDVAQLETLEQLKEDSNESATQSIRVSRRIGWTSIIFMVIIGVTSIFVMFRTSKKQIEKMEEHLKKEIEIEEKREEEKQIDLLKTLFTELIFLEGNLNSYKETFSRQNVYPFYELWDIDVSLYLKNLSHKLQNKETISLKKELMVIKDKLFIINNMKIETKKLEEERGQERIIKDLGLIKINRDQIIKIIDKDVLPVLKKSKKFIEENFDIKSKK